MGVRYLVCIGTQLFRQLYILELERKITNFVKVGCNNDEATIVWNFLVEAECFLLTICAHG